MTFKKFKKIAVELGWNVSVYENDIDLDFLAGQGEPDALQRSSRPRRTNVRREGVLENG